MLILDIVRDLGHRAGAEQRDADHDVAQVFRMQAAHERAHTVAFQLENAVRFAGRDERIYRRVSKVEMIHVHLDPAVLANERDRVADDRECAQPQKVHFQQPQRLDVVHVVLRRDALIFFVEDERRIVCDPGLRK